MFTRDHRGWAELIGTVNHKKMLYNPLQNDVRQNFTYGVYIFDF